MLDFEYDRPLWLVAMGAAVVAAFLLVMCIHEVGRTRRVQSALAQSRNEVEELQKEIAVLSLQVHQRDEENGRLKGVTDACVAHDAVALPKYTLGTLALGLAANTDHYPEVGSDGDAAMLNVDRRGRVRLSDDSLKAIKQFFGDNACIQQPQFGR